MDIYEREQNIALYDFYKGLLTNKQCLYFEEYYFDDLSFAEIAQENKVSRNAVFDQIKKTIKNLENYEHILKLKSKYDQLEKLSSSENIQFIKKELKRIIEE